MKRFKLGSTLSTLFCPFGYYTFIMRLLCVNEVMNTYCKFLLIFLNSPYLKTRNPFDEIKDKYGTP